MTNSSNESMPGEANKLVELRNSADSLRILSTLHSNGALQSLTLRDECELSKNTLIQTLESLMARGWVTQNSNHKYTITTSGSLVLQEFHRASKSLHAIERLNPILEYVPASEFDIPLRTLESAEMDVTTDGDWFETRDETVTLMRNANSFSIMTPGASPRALRQIWEGLSDGETTAEYLITDEAAEVYQNHPGLAETFAEIRQSNSFNITVADEPLPFYKEI